MIGLSLLLFGLFVGTPSQTKPALTTKWVYHESKSAMDDSKTVVLSLEAENIVQGWLRNPSRPTLFLRCKENKTDAYITVGLAANPEYGTDDFSVRLRFDSQA